MPQENMENIRPRPFEWEKYGQAHEREYDLLLNYCSLDPKTVEGQRNLQSLRQLEDGGLIDKTAHRPHKASRELAQLDAQRATNRLFGKANVPVYSEEQKEADILREARYTRALQPTGQPVIQMTREQYSLWLMQEEARRQVAERELARQRAEQEAVKGRNRLKHQMPTPPARGTVRAPWPQQVQKFEEKNR